MSLFILSVTYILLLFSIEYEVGPVQTQVLKQGSFPSSLALYRCEKQLRASTSLSYGSSFTKLKSTAGKKNSSTVFNLLCQAGFQLPFILAYSCSYDIQIFT